MLNSRFFRARSWCRERWAQLTQGKPSFGLKRKSDNKTKAKACLSLSEMQRLAFSSLQAYLRLFFFFPFQFSGNQANSFQNQRTLYKENCAKLTGFSCLCSKSSGEHYWVRLSWQEASFIDNASPFSSMNSRIALPCRQQTHFWEDHLTRILQTLLQVSLNYSSSSIFRAVSSRTAFLLILQLI